MNSKIGFFTNYRRAGRRIEWMTAKMKAREALSLYPSLFLFAYFFSFWFARLLRGLGLAARTLYNHITDMGADARAGRASRSSSYTVLASVVPCYADCQTYQPYPVHSEARSSQPVHGRAL